MDDKTTLVEMVNNSSAMSASDWIAIGVALLGLLGAIFTMIFSSRSSKKSNEVKTQLANIDVKTQVQRRFIDTVSTQRVEWINNVRKAFAEFQKNANDFSQILDRHKLNIHYENDQERINNCQSNLNYLQNLIELYLNPKEVM